MFRAMRTAVETALADALDELGYPADDLGIETPPEDVDAVLASSVAYRLAGEAGAPPPEVAAELAATIDPAAYDYVGAVTTAGPYVNFLPSDRYFAETLVAGQEETYGTLPDRETTLVVEHTSANPTGPVHVGRARNPIIGDALATLLEYAGYDVERHYYVNDAGRQIALFTWAYETFEEAELPEQKRDSPEYDLTRYYQHGTTVLEEADPERKEEIEAEIQTILRGLEDGDEETLERVHAVVETVLSGMRRTLDRLPASFDEFVKETTFMRDGSTEDVVARLKELDAAVYEDDAWQLDFPDIDKNLVFLRGDGTSLYPTRDLAHHEWKLDNFDEAVTVLGEDHKLHDEQITATLELLGHDTDRIRSVHYSWVDLPDGQLSTRAGADLLLDDLLDEAIDRAREEVETRLDDRIRDDDLDAEDVERIAHQVGIGAVRYDVVSKQPTKGITFEWDRALDFEAQSAPYVQYVHARASGILAQADEDSLGTLEDVTTGGDLLTHDAERDLLREIARFPAVVEEAAEDLEPHLVATYTRDIAEAFNTFYRECPVLDAPGDRGQARLALVVATRNTVANALDVLGVAAPDSM